MIFLQGVLGILRTAFIFYLCAEEEGCVDSFLSVHKCQMLLEKEDKSKRIRTPLYTLYIYTFIYSDRLI